VVAVQVRVSERSVERWRQAWLEQGEVQVLSQGSLARPWLSDERIARLQRELERTGRCA
jgi:transposase